MGVGESIPTENNTGLIPIYKKAGARLYPANYQPVNVTSVICMLMESIIKDALTGYLDVDDIISPYQHGFILIRVTVLALTICQTEQWMNTGKIHFVTVTK